MRAYFGIKTYEDYHNKERIIGICDQLKLAGIDVLNLSRDIQLWGDVSVDTLDFFAIRFREIKRADFVVIDATEGCITLGVEVGFAKAFGKPVFVIADQSVVIDPALEAAATHSFQYKGVKDISGLVSTHWLE